MGTVIGEVMGEVMGSVCGSESASVSNSQLAPTVALTSLGLSGKTLEPVIDLLARGGVLAIPTESSYALAVDPTNAAGVAAIYRLKGRSAAKPLPVVAADWAALSTLGIDPKGPAVRWLAGHWPAPLTGLLAIENREEPVAAAAGGLTLAVRVPALASLRQLLKALGHCLTATSANRSGEAPMVDPRQVARWLAGEEAMVIDGGILSGGAPSTLVRFQGGRAWLVRPGAFELGDGESDVLLAGELQD